MTPPPDAGRELLGSGRSADVYALDDHRVLRRYRDGQDASAEAGVMAYVRGHGFPAPRVYEAAGPDLVMERLTGPSLADALLTGEVDPAYGGRLLARLHTRLHALPARLCAAGTDRILHRDLHPYNVMLTGQGPVLIDWCDTTEGPPGYDVALTAVIIATASLSAADPVLVTVTDRLLTEFLARVTEDPLPHLEPALAHRSEWARLPPGEQARLPLVPQVVRAALGRSST